MPKYHRELRHLMAEVGLTPIEIRQGRKHLKIVCAEGVLIAAATPSDKRNLLNVRAAARRLMSD